MANANEYGFDPYQAEEDDLKQKALEAAALLKVLRQPKQMYTQGGVLTSGQGAGDGFMQEMERSRAQRTLDDLPRQRKALQERAQADLEASLSGAGADEETRSLFRSPATRQQGAEVLKATLARRQQSKDYDAFRSQIGGSPQSSNAGAPTADQLREMSVAHPNPMVKAWAKQQLEAYHPNSKDPDKLYPSREGGYQPDENALGFYGARRGVEETARAAQDIVEVPIGGGRTQRMTRAQAVQMLGGQQPQSPQSAGAPPVGVGVAPPSAGAVGPGSGALPNAVRAAGGGAAGLSIPEEDAKVMMKIITDPQADTATKSKLAQQLSAGGWNFDSQTGRLEPKGQPSAPAQGSQFGVSDPEAGKMRQMGMESGRKILDAERALVSKDTAALKTIQEMSELNQSGQVMTGPFAGPLFEAKRAAHLMGVRDDPQVAATEKYEKLKLTQLRDSLKAYGSGTGISNLDLITAQKTLPGLENTPEGRQLIIDYMQGQIFTNIKNFQDAEKYFTTNRTLDGFEPQNYDKDGRLITQQEMQQRLMQTKRDTEFEKRRQSEHTRLKGEEPVLKNALSDLGDHSYQLATGDPEHLQKFGEGAAVGAAMVPAGRVAGAALPYALRAGAAAGRGVGAGARAVGQAATSPLGQTSLIGALLWHAMKKDSQ